MLGGGIVQLLRDPPPFVDLEGQQPLGQRADLLLHPVLVGDVLGDAEDQFGLAVGSIG